MIRSKADFTIAETKKVFECLETHNMLQVLIQGDQSKSSGTSEQEGKIECKTKNTLFHKQQSQIVWKSRIGRHDKDELSRHHGLVLSNKKHKKSRGIDKNSRAN